jgi:lysyl-tRNA synthetase class 1
MHWAERIAEEIIRNKPDKEEYVCAAGISPSGSVHIGNFRDVVTSWFVVKALRRMGRKARLLFSWDEFDRFRKAPANVAKVSDAFEKYIGCPYVDIPDPFGGCHENYARHFQAEFMEAVSQFGIDMDCRYQGEMYRSGKYADQILRALAKRLEIFDILDAFKTQSVSEGEREAYYPVSIFCPECGRDSTKILSLSHDCVTAEYECKCGHGGTFNFKTDFNCKLVWRVDWPMRWMYEGVDFEPGGKDHASPTGSYQNGRLVSEKIFNYPAPVFQGYEFIGIRGVAGKMSGSSGLNLTPGTLLQIYQPEIILWLYSRTEPSKAFDFCLDEGILQHYFEFDKQYAAFMEGAAKELNASVMEYSLIGGRGIETAPMGLLVQMGSVVDFNVPMLELIFEKIGAPYKYEQFADRLSRARYWLEYCAPESANRLNTRRNWAYYQTLDDGAKREAALLFGYIRKGGYSLEELKAELYAIPKRVYGDDAQDLKRIQGEFFTNIYQLLIGKGKGPRLYLFLYAIDPERYAWLLDFSSPPAEDELLPLAGDRDGEKEAERPAAAAGYGDGEPGPVEPLKAEISIDAFNTLDLRVCKVLKCAEIRKSNNCYKITVDDGTGQRVIVSGIKKYYSPEDLIGKKIIVAANLKPARIAGVASEGMLLAATNGACGCQVIFADGRVPEGTAVR